MGNITAIKNYIVQEHIGGGGFGDVYRATRPVIGGDVAIKVIKSDLANKPDFIRRFENEAQMIAHLDHLHIVQLYDYWRDPDGAYLVMRWLRGGNLKEALQDGPLDVNRVRIVLDQLATVLAHAHRQGVIHRDLKPANILFDEDGNAYLADFGIAKDLSKFDAHTQTGEFLGTVGYTAPEQIRGEVVTPRTDVYSLGVMLYEMLAGEHPFPKLNAIEQIYKSLNEPIPLLQHLDTAIQDGVNQIIQNATAKDPTQRYADPLEMATAFREEVADLPEISPQNIVEALTRREQEILQLIIDGKTNREIATTLFITISTVKWYINQLYKKLGVRNRVQAIVRARELNLIVGDVGADVSGNGHSMATYLALTDLENPYKGLQAFQLADEKDFYGRAKITTKLLKRFTEDVSNQRFLAILGPSGSGKSSLVRAGFIPALLRQQSGQETWYLADMLPGSHPIDELEIALIRLAADQGANLGEQLRRDERGLLRVAQLILPDDGQTELLLVIDQFEEVFTLVEDEETRTHFLNLLLTAVQDPRSRVRVVVTLRADFYDRPLQYAEFGAMLRERMETVLPLSAEELEAAITKPAAKLGVTFEAGLVSSIVSDINYQPGALPLLQYALTELFDQRAGRIITRQVYDEIGGTIGALAKRADEIFGEFQTEGQAVAKQMFMRLVTLGEGTEDTRRRVNRSELLALTSQVDVMDEIIHTFADYRLLSLDHDPVTREPTVEVAHEAILREWERLRTWLNDSRDDIKSQRLLATATQAWTDNNRDNSYIWTGKRLAEFEIWVTQTELSLTPTEQDFIQMSLSESQRAEDVETERQVQKERLEQRARRVLQGLVAVFLIAAIVGGVLAWEANRQAEIAKIAQKEAEESEHDALEKFAISLSAQAEDIFEVGDQELGILLALASVEELPETWQARSSLWKIITNYSFGWAYTHQAGTGPIEDISWSPDGQYIAITTHASVVILDINNPDDPVLTDARLNASDRDSGSKVTWTPDSQYLISMIDQPISDAEESDDVTEIRIYNLISNEKQELVIDHEMNDMKLSPVGDTLAFVAENGSLYLWEFQQNGQLIEFATYPVALSAIDWSQDGQYLLTGAKDNNAQVWNINTNELQIVPTGHAGEITNVEWSHDQLRFATGSRDQTVRIWSNGGANTYDLITSLGGYEGAITDIEWQYDDQRLAIASLDGNVRLLNTEGWDLHEEFIWNQTWANSIVLSPDNQYIAMAEGGRLEVRALKTNRFIFSHQELGQYAAQWSPDGRYVVNAGGIGNTLVLTDVASGEIIWQLESKSGAGINWSPDGSQILDTPFEPLAYIRDADTGDILMSIPFPEEEQWANFASWSPDGKYIVLGTNGGVHLVDADKGTIVNSISLPCWGSFPSWSPDSSRIAVGCMMLAEWHENAGVQIWNINTDEIEYAFMGHEDSPYATAWSPDSSAIISTGSSGTVIAWDPETGKILQEFAGHDQTKPAVGVAWTPDGKYFASTGIDQNIFVWEMDNPSPILRIEADSRVWVPAWSPDGQYLMVSHINSLPKPSVYQILTSTDEIIQQAYDCCITRELTDSERATFGLPERND